MLHPAVGQSAGARSSRLVLTQRRRLRPIRTPLVVFSACSVFSLWGLALLSGCGGGTARPLSVRWHLTDGRTCFEAGVVGFRLSIEGGALENSLATVRCSADPKNMQVTLPGALPGARLLGEGDSAAEAPLYRGELTLGDPLPAEQELPLVFTGGK